MRRRPRAPTIAIAISPVVGISRAPAANLVVFRDTPAADGREVVRARAGFGRADCGGGGDGTARAAGPMRRLGG